jgi:CHAD domain-containing protein
MKPPDAIQETISALGQQRLEKFAALIPRIVVSGDSKAIHDARVASRRTQEILRALSPKKNNPDKLLRALRDIRKILGQPRNFDVMLRLVEDKIAAANNPAARKAWDQLRTHLTQRRSRALERTREALRNYDIINFAARCRAAIDVAAKE